MEGGDPLRSDNSLAFALVLVSDFCGLIPMEGGGSLRLHDSLALTLALLWSNFNKGWWSR